MLTSASLPPAPPLIFSTGFDPQTGVAVPVAPAIVRVTAPNASPYTFTGTNSFIVGTDSVAVIDPGPADKNHRQALLTAIAGRPVEAIILTHTHRDHSAMAAEVARTLNAPLWFGGRHRLSRPQRFLEPNPVKRSSDWALIPDRTLRDGETISVGGVDLEIIATPGHCANHLAFGMVGTLYLLSGDHIMGWSSTLVSVPDGSMRDYLASLDRVLALPYTHYLPAHGGEITDGPGYGKALKAHRLSRDLQVLTAIQSGSKTIAAITRLIYPAIKLTLLPAAAMTVTAHVEHLESLGKITVRRTIFGTKITAKT